MRKAKLILSGVALFAVVGGAFAFKATRGAQSFCRVAGSPGACTTTINDITFFTTNVATTGVTTYCTNVLGANCVATVTRLGTQE